jgi:hypothetical protein
VIGGMVVVVAGGYSAAWGVQRIGTSIPLTVLALGVGAATAAALALAAGLVEADERAAAGRLLDKVRR